MIARSGAPWLAAMGQDAFWRRFGLADPAFPAEVEPQFVDLLRSYGEPMTRGAQAVLAPTFPPGLGHLPQPEAPDVVRRDIADCAFPFRKGQKLIVAPAASRAQVFQSCRSIAASCGRSDPASSSVSASWMAERGRNGRCNPQ